VTGQFGAQVVVASLPGRSLPRGQFVQARHQFGGGQLSWNVPAEIMHGQPPGEPGDQRLWGPHPPDPQATPDVLQ
jgi:hypothetical protein